jgi:hypothetical protein
MSRVLVAQGHSIVGDGGATAISSGWVPFAEPPF